MPIMRKKKIADNCDTFKLIAVKTNEKGNCLLTFAPQGEQGSTVLQVIDSGTKDASYSINTPEGDVAVNVSTGSAILASLAGKTSKYADQVEKSWYEHLDTMLTNGESIPFNWEERFTSYVGCIMHIATTPSCIERNGFINFCNFDVSEVEYEDRMEFITDTLAMFEPADEKAIEQFVQNKKASAPKRRKPVVTRD